MKKIFVSIAFISLLAACGQKGPLVLPEQPQPSSGQPAKEKSDDKAKPSQSNEDQPKEVE